MISELHIEDWKSYKQAVLYIDPLSVLIGTNASGKSNALDALQFLNRVASGSLLTAALQGDAVQTSLRGGLEWAARQPSKRFALGVVCRPDEQTDFTYRIECLVGENRCELDAESLVRSKFRTNRNGKRQHLGRLNLFKTDQSSENSPTLNARLYNGTKGAPRQVGRGNAALFQLSSQRLRQEIQEGVDEISKSLREIFILDPIPSHMRSFTPFSDKLESDARNIAGVIAAMPDEDQSNVEDVLTKYLSRLPEKDITRVYAEPVGKFKSDAMLYCEEGWTENASTVDARGMSDGTLRLLAVLTALLTRPKGSLLVIEEVDNGLHPSRAGLLIEVLKNLGSERGVDVLITTHNPALLDAMGPEIVQYVTVAHRDLESGESLLTLLEGIKQLPKLLARGTIGSLASRGLIEAAVNSSPAQSSPAQSETSREFLVSA